jgi:hypothetical protein
MPGLSGPTGGVVGGPVAGQRKGDPVRAVRQRAGDDAAVFPTGLQARGVRPGRFIAVPHPIPRSINARRSSTLPSRLIPPSGGGRRIRTASETTPTPGTAGPVRATGSGHRPPHRRPQLGSLPAGDADQRAERAGRDQLGELGLGLGDLLFQVGQQGQVRRPAPGAR